MSEKLTNQALYVQLGQLAAAIPDLTLPTLSRETLQWLARVHALLDAAGAVADAAHAVKYQTDNLIGSIILKPDRNSAATKIVAALYRALALVELHVPADVQGAFIGVGNAHDAFAAIGKVIGEATADILIVDPYMDANTLSEYVAQAREGVPARLLTDDKSCKPAIRPAVTTWRRQHGNARPVALRTTAPGVLHDRLIFVDQKTAWMLTQSLNAFAARSPGTLVRSGADVQDAKIAAYRSIWDQATEFE